MRWRSRPRHGLHMLRWYEWACLALGLCIAVAAVTTRAASPWWSTAFLALGYAGWVVAAGVRGRP
jgi:hypothetical protein